MSGIGISKTCFSCGKVSVVKVKQEQLFKYNAGALVQDAFPDLSRTEREILVSGMCPNCQSRAFHFPLVEGEWGTNYGTCPCCDSSIYDIDKIDDNTFRCAQCGTKYPCVDGQPDFDNVLEY